MAAVLVAVLALQVLSLARVAVAHPDGYTPAADLRATLAGDPCGLQSALLVETDPAAGVLSPVPSGPAAPPGLPPATVDAGGSRLPGIAASGPGATPWYALDTREPARPVVVTVAGPAGGLAAEFGRAGQVLTRVPLGGGDTGPTDRRLPVPAGADTVRLAVAAGPGGAPTGPVVAAASLPRVPVLTPMDRVLPRGTTAILDWPVAFVFPCLRPAPLPPGTAALPRWRVAPPADDTAAAITYAPDLGGPFATARLLVTQHRLPTYLRDDPIRATPQLYRWDPVVPLRTLSPSVRDGPVPGAVTPLRVPRL